jgi:hypothetical protein
MCTEINLDSRDAPDKKNASNYATLHDQQHYFKKNEHSMATIASNIHFLFGQNVTPPKNKRFFAKIKQSLVL